VPQGSRLQEQMLKFRKQVELAFAQESNQLTSVISEGKPECEQGHALVFDGFDKDTYTAWFRGDEEKCAACPLQGLCEKQFGYSFTDNPFFNGPVPQGSRLQEQMLKFRKQVELAFAQESNQLTSV
ncbi:hypothetical protein CTI14_49275, partial [Methylobacterium radiotolerans]